MSAFLLVVCALIGTILIVKNPMPQLATWMEGKRLSQIESELDKYVDDSSKSQLAGQTLKWGCYISLVMLFTFFIEPVAVLSAVTGQVGNQFVGYLMLLIILWGWWEFIHSLIFRKKTTKPTVEIVTAEGTPIQGQITNVDEEVHFGNPVLRWGRTILFALPTLYLWYLFAIAIHILPAK